MNNSTSKPQHFIPIVTPSSEILQALAHELDTPLGASQMDALATLKIMMTQALEKGASGLILQLCPESCPDILTVSHLHALSPLLGELFGELLVQNEAGDKVIAVYDRDRYASMFQGARYHQTREGGSIHTDNVNIPAPWDYLILTCLAPALVGGENILVSAQLIHEELRRNYPQVLETLTQNFYWEMRGVADSLYEAPIITYNREGAALFRHLRPYMESAHRKAQVALTDRQLFALDVLDALTNSSAHQQHYRMKKGDLLFTIDAQVLHGRTCFSDAFETITLPEFLAGKPGLLKRTMERLWIRM